MKKWLFILMLATVLVGCGQGEKKAGEEKKETEVVQSGSEDSVDTLQVRPKMISISDEVKQEIQAKWDERGEKPAGELDFFPAKAEKTEDGGITVYTIIHNGLDKPIHNLTGNVKLIGIEEPVAEKDVSLSEDEYGKLESGETWLTIFEFPADTLYEDDPQVEEFSLAVQMDYES